MAIMNDANGDFDYHTQDPAYAPQHATRRPGQTREDARGEANRFIRGKICLARELAGRGFEDQPLTALGQAIHTLQDSTSPAHFDFQEAWPATIPSSIWNWTHYRTENFDPGAGSVADFQTINAWDYYNGAPMPSDFFVINYFDDRNLNGFPIRQPANLNRRKLY